jgi:hypothetical protein
VNKIQLEAKQKIDAKLSDFFTTEAKNSAKDAEKTV